MQPKVHHKFFLKVIRGLSLLPIRKASRMASSLLVVLCTDDSRLAVPPHCCQFLRKPRRKDLGPLMNIHVKFYLKLTMQCL